MGPLPLIIFTIVPGIMPMESSLPRQHFPALNPVTLTDIPFLKLESGRSCDVFTIMFIAIDI